MMMKMITVFFVVVVVIDVLIVYSCCVVAGRADSEIERLVLKSTGEQNRRNQS